MSASSALSLLKVAAPAKATATMIIIHGLGDSGQGWTFLSDAFHQMPDFQHINFVFPNAPTKPLSVAGGQLVPQWFDIYEFGNPNAKSDVPGFFNTVDQIKDLVKKEVENGIPAERVLIGGFSQEML
ncbi:unnamed protein product [Ambrosiozyma monospora]|uniref:Unnamed protein product n=1 Tax=Ambrosiozyma monospora TaxID=43982 RepID=A0ACB5UAR2_AMBMO|nr:unnamed protein product [Ambrosiozyma monospora]